MYMLCSVIGEREGGMEEIDPQTAGGGRENQTGPGGNGIWRL